MAERALDRASDRQGVFSRNSRAGFAYRQGRRSPGSGTHVRP
ncbi:hypothetical protein [Streptomyces flaveolus]